MSPFVAVVSAAADEQAGFEGEETEEEPVM
jgi:hypothetical protein